MPKPDKAPSVVPAPQPLPAVPSAALASETDFSLLGLTVPNWFWAAAVLFLVAVARLAYDNSFHTELALDNALIINQDIRLRDWKLPEKDPVTSSERPGLDLIRTEGYWYPSFPSDLYRPLTTITYAFNWSGPDLSDPVHPGVSKPAPTYLRVRLLFFCLLTGAVFLLVRAFARPWWLGLVVAGSVAGLISLPDWWHWSFTGNGLNADGNGPNPDISYGFHVTNLLIHILNVLMVLAVARRLTTRPWVALLAAAIFAVHPVETESVTNIVGRADELCTFWMLLAFWCYLRSTVAGLLRPLWLLAFMLPAAAAMFSKESGFMLVLLLPLYDFIFRWPRLTGPLGERLRTAIFEFGFKGWIALVLPVLLFLFVRHGMLETQPTYGQLFIDNPIARVPAELSEVTAVHKLTFSESVGAWWYKITLSGELTAFKVLGRYLALLVFPNTLSCDYSYNAIPLYGEGTLWENVQCFIGLGAVAGLLWLAWSRRLASPLFSFGVCFFFGMILPTSNILFPIGSIMGERFLYLPSIGFCLAAALGVAVLLEKTFATMALPSDWRGLARLGLPLLLLGALGWRTYERNKDWASEFSLWQSAVAAEPNSFKVHKGLANGYLNRASQNLDPAVREKGVDDAITAAEVGLDVINSRPLPINRQDNTLFCDLGMYYNLKGDMLMAPGRLNGPVPLEAERFYQKGVDIMIRARNVDTWVNGASRGDRLQRGIKPDKISDVGNPRVHNQLAQSYLGLGTVHQQLATGFFEQFRRQLDETSKAASLLDRISLEAILKNVQPAVDSILQAQQKLDTIAKSAPAELRPRLEETIQLAQATVLHIGLMGQALDEATKVATYACHLAPNQVICYLLLSQALINNGKYEASAISMLQALQLQAMQMDATGIAKLPLWQNLQFAYANLGQRDAIITPTATNPGFGVNVKDNAMVRRHFYQAAAGIVQLMVDAKDFGNAAQYRKIAQGNYQVPDSELPPVPPVPPKPGFFERLKKWIFGGTADS